MGGSAVNGLAIREGLAAPALSDNLNVHKRTILGPRVATIDFEVRLEPP